MANVTIAGGSDETRLLLRGLVRLHHHRVIAEGPGPETCLESSPDGEASVLILEADLENDAWRQHIAEFRSKDPARRVVLLTGDRSVAFEGRARGLGIDRLLLRPFAVHDLVDAIEPAPPAASGQT